MHEQEINDELVEDNVIHWSDFLSDVFTLQETKTHDYLKSYFKWSSRVGKGKFQIQMEPISE